MNNIQRLFICGIFFCSSIATAFSQSVKDENNPETIQNLNIFAKIDKVLLEELNIDMVTCQPGSFIMGSPKSELGRIEIVKSKFSSAIIYNETQHRVTLTKPFQIAKYELTQKQFKAIMGFNPSLPNISGFIGDDLPVGKITREIALEFCKQLNEKFSNKLPKGFKFDLPTNAQWEYACRAGSTAALYNGKELTQTGTQCKNLDEIAWYGGNSAQIGVHTIGLKKPNAWGIYDMLGNVCEICKDSYEDYTAEDRIDPISKNSSWSQLYRGGDCGSRPEHCRSAYRFDFRPRKPHANGHMGMRLAIVAED